MKLNKLIAKITKKAQRGVTAAPTVPPHIVESLSRVIKYLEKEEKASYKRSSVFMCGGHIYRDIKRLEIWLLPLVSGKHSAMLPSLGDVVLTLTGSRLIPPRMLDRVLDAHLMHRWDDKEDIDAVEGRYSQHRDVTSHGGTVETFHYVPDGVCDEMIEAKVQTKITVTTTVSARYEDPCQDWHSEGYVHRENDNGGPLSLEWEEWL